MLILSFMISFDWTELFTESQSLHDNTTPADEVDKSEERSEFFSA